MHYTFGSVYRLLAYLATIFICVLTIDHVSAASNMAPANQTFDILLPNVVFGTDASLAVASDGSVHVAFSPDGPVQLNVYPVQYASCMAQCGEAKNWAVIAVGNVGYDGGGVRLRLDSEGRPRLMWYARGIADREGIYVYAECNQKCLIPENWQVMGLARSRQYSLNDEEYFALDLEGQPHFVFQNSDRVAFYAGCERTCTQQANWRATPINTPGFEPFNFELVYDTKGRTRVSFVTQPRIADTYVGFASCDVNCSSASQWSVLPRLAQIGVDYDHSLTVDRQGRPRLAIYTGGYPNGPTPYDYQLLWMGCDDRCASEASWFYQFLPLPSVHGEDVDVTMDAQDRPRLVYHVGGSGGALGGIGQAWCTARCATNDSVWQSAMLMTTERLDLLEPRRNCSWLYTGQHPSFVLDPAGTVQVAYDAEVICDRAESAGRQIRFAVQRQP